MKAKQSKTYTLGRVCLYCGEPIEDQARANKMHCSPWLDEYGIRHDCKRKRHQIRHQEKEDVLLDHNAKQRELTRQIENIVKTHGDIVTNEVLDAYGINLFESLKIDFNAGSGTSSFLGYQIISNAITKTHKIVKNDK